MNINRWATIAQAGGNHLFEVEHRPAVADLAVGRESMLVTVEAAEGPEVDHAPMVTAFRLMT